MSKQLRRFWRITMMYRGNETLIGEVSTIRVVPRPFLLYVTTPTQANDWTQRLRDLQIRRSGSVHGSTPADVREEVIEGWHWVTWMR